MTMTIFFCIPISCRTLGRTTDDGTMCVLPLRATELCHSGLYEELTHWSTTRKWNRSASTTFPTFPLLLRHGMRVPCHYVMSLVPRPPTPKPNWDKNSWSPTRPPPAGSPHATFSDVVLSIARVFPPGTTRTTGV